MLEMAVCATDLAQSLGHWYADLNERVSVGLRRGSELICTSVSMLRSSLEPAMTDRVGIKEAASSMVGSGEGSGLRTLVK